MSGDGVPVMTFEEVGGPDGCARLRQMARDGVAVARSAELGGPIVLEESLAERLLTEPRIAGAVAMPILHASGVTSGPLHDLWAVLMFGKDGADHDRIRRVTAAHFTPRAVERLRPEAVRTAEQLLDAAIARNGSSIELFHDYALPLAARVQAALLGLPVDDLDRIVPWALDLVEAFGVLDEQAARAATAAAEAFIAYLDARFAGPPSDPGTVLATVRADPTLGPAEQRGLVANLMFGGLDATAKALTSAVHLLVTRPDQLAAVTGGCPAEHVVAEALRFSPPLTGLPRLAMSPVTLGPLRVEPGELVMVMTAGLAGDPVRYPDPERFDVARTPGKQFAFGAGPHYCIGANLAKLVLAVGIDTLVARLPGLRLAGDAEWAAGTFGGIVHLPLSTR